MITPRALAAWAGTDRLSALPAHPPGETSRASAALALLVWGIDVPAAWVPELAELESRGLIERRGDRIHARVSMLPLGRALLVCDRLDTDDGLDVVCWPDDSSYHLALALPPGRRKRWLDLGCGSAFAPLWRPELAHAIVGADINPRAVHYARLGAQLSGIGHLEVDQRDLGAGLPDGGYDLVSCNAPIPAAPYRARWRHADPGFFARLFADAARLVAPDGLVVVHAALDALLPVLGDLPGERIAVAYTPADVRGFAVAWWQPAGDPRLVTARRPLSAARPHVTHEDRLVATAGALAPL